MTKPNREEKIMRRRSLVRAGLMIGMALLSVLGQTVAAAPRGNDKGNGGKPSGWRDDFTGSTVDDSRWVNASGQAPGYIPWNHIGYYDPTHVRVQNGYLVISLTQDYGFVDGLLGVISNGGLIYTKETYGYGTYEWRMRMSSTAVTPEEPGSPVSGSVSAGFNYVNNSQTEIDFELGGHLPGWLYMTNWRNTNPRRDPTDSQETYTAASVPDISSKFHTYKFVWEKGKITFYMDDGFQTSHVTDIPSAPAYFMINHWGTNNPWWGGLATVGPSRYFYIDWVQYTPQ
ncbi:MAG: hypothetical protein A3G20_06175 [Acidobacteria bacterium RIFCSPLOWO2_12_FULL_59_11]|nr:MAG: hypothetical protein A3G20_06175 [Acidobacteria bacterium RIFCSPLOWO2_12_FULL_59_11]